MESLGLIVVTEHRTEERPGSFHPSPFGRHTRMFLNVRERRESEHGPVVVIVQPDLRRELWLDSRTQTFTVRPVFELVTAEEKRQLQKRGARSVQKHSISDREKTRYNIFVHAERMEETKDFFGYPARRYVTHRNDVYPSSAGKKLEAVTDGWYLDFQHPAMSDSSRSQRMGIVHVGNEEPIIHRSGEKQYSGMPAHVVTTTRQTYSIPQGQQEHVSKQTVEIVALSETILDPMLFEIPEGFREQPLFPSRWNGLTQQLEKVLRRVRAA